METPKYLQVLWAYKWLLLFGAIVAAAAAFFAGFRVVDGQVAPRTEPVWNASATMLVTSDSDMLFQAESPGVPISQQMTDTQIADLSQSALVYAYIISSDSMQSAVEATIGPLDDSETITALRRTTQPGGDERFPGRYNLPVLQTIGSAATPERAEEIARATADTFVAYISTQQDAQQIAPAERVKVAILGLEPAEEADTSNPMIPVVVTFFGVFLAFVVLTFVIAGIRSASAKRGAAKERDADAADGFDAGFDADEVDRLDDALADADAPVRRTRPTPREDVRA